MKTYKPFILIMFFMGAVIFIYMSLWGIEHIFEITFGSKLTLAFFAAFGGACGILYQWRQKSKAEKKV